MTVIQAVTTVLHKYVDFTGRARRSEYWMFALCVGLLEVALMLLGVSLSVAFASSAAAEATGVLIFLVGYLLIPLAIALPSMAVTARRLHDRGLSGWWQLLYLIPFFGSIAMIVLLVQDSDPAPNRFGPNPKAPSAVGGPHWHHVHGAPQDRPFGGYAVGPWASEAGARPPLGPNGGHAAGPSYPPPPPRSHPQDPYLP